MTHSLRYSKGQTGFFAPYPQNISRAALRHASRGRDCHPDTVQPCALRRRRDHQCTSAPRPDTSCTCCQSLLTHRLRYEAQARSDLRKLWVHMILGAPTTTKLFPWER